MSSSRLSGLLVGAYLGASAISIWAVQDRALWTWMVAACFVAAGVAAFIYWKGAPRLRIVLLVAVAVRIGWLAVPASLSDDSYRYAWDGQLVADDVNPYEFTPEDSALLRYQDTPVFRQLNSSGFYSVYPPVTQYAFAAASWLSQGSFLRFFYLWKALIVLLEVVALALLARAVSPGLLLLFAWNPAVIVAGAGQGHTDVLLALPLVAAVLLSRRERWNAAASLVAVAALIKIWPAIVAPAFLRRRAAVLAGVLVAGALAAPFVAPFVLENVRQSLDLYVRYFEFNAGPYYAIKEVLLGLTGDDWSKQLGPFLRRVFFFGVIGIGVWAWRNRPALEDVLFYTYALYLVTATTVHPWYLYPLLLLGALRGREIWGWQWLTVVSMGTYLLYVEGPYWPFVIAGWAGWLVVGLVSGRRRWVQQVLLRRARWKAEWADTYLTTSTGPILDLGGGEGYVASALARRRKQEVTVLEVWDGRGEMGVAHPVLPTDRAAAPPTQAEPQSPEPSDYVLYDGLRFPFPDQHFGAAIAVFSLHHAEDSDACLRELRRTVSGEVLVVESVVTSTFSALALRLLDPLANGLRRSFVPDESEPRFDSPEGWRKRFRAAGYQITGESIRYNILHRKHLFRLAPS